MFNLVVDRWVGIVSKSIAKKRMSILTKPLSKPLVKEIDDLNEALRFKCVTCFSFLPIESLCVVVEKDNNDPDQLAEAKSNSTPAIRSQAELDDCNRLILTNESYQYCVDCMKEWVKTSLIQQRGSNVLLDLTHIKIPLSQYALEPLTIQLFQDKFHWYFERLINQQDLLKRIDLTPLRVTSLVTFYQKKHQNSVDELKGVENKRARQLLNKKWKEKLVKILAPLIQRAYISYNLDSLTRQVIVERLSCDYEHFPTMKSSFDAVLNMKWLELVWAGDLSSKKIL